MQLLLKKLLSVYVCAPIKAYYVNMLMPLRAVSLYDDLKFHFDIFISECYQVLFPLFIGHNTFVCFFANIIFFLALASAPDSYPLSD